MSLKWEPMYYKAEAELWGETVSVEVTPFGVDQYDSGPDGHGWVAVSTKNKRGRVGRALGYPDAESAIAAAEHWFATYFAKAQADHERIVDLIVGVTDEPTS